jgi:hypothetical protein
LVVRSGRWDAAGGENETAARERRYYGLRLAGNTPQGKQQRRPAVRKIRQDERILPSLT